MVRAEKMILTTKKIVSGKTETGDFAIMKKWWETFLMFCKNKAYVMLLALTAVCSYGYKVTHFAIGIDDTPYAYYFKEGLAAIVGRWVLFLLNKVVHIADIAPFLTDFAAVLILMAAVTVWCVLFYSILGDRIPKIGYFFFSGIFLSCPLIGEVFTYYLHNGIAIGYLCCGISLCCFREGLMRWRDIAGENQAGKRIRILPGVSSVIFLCVALGCYESFMVVWLLGICLLLLTERLAGKRKGMWKAIVMAGVIAVLGMVLRSVMIATVTGVFGLEYLKGDAIRRSITEMAGWLFEPGACAELGMVLKRLFAMYGLFAYAYYPIKIFVGAALVIGCYSLYRTIRSRDPWILLLCIGGFMASFLLAIVEGKATLYRSAQFLPVICGYGALLLVYAFRRLWKIQEVNKPDTENPDKKKQSAEDEKYTKGSEKSAIGEENHAERILRSAGRAVVTIALGAVLWNQCADLNHWFYVDYMKYENAKEVISRIAYDLEHDFDTSKPVVFTGTYEVPQGIIGDAYVGYNTKTFFKMKRIADNVDEHLLEKFYRPYGLWVAQTPSLSVINWGKYAFDDDSELIKFFVMHGYDLKPQLDQDVYYDAELYALDLPAYPQPGYIVDMGEYLLVNFS